MVCSAGNPLRPLLGFGFFVQGFRGFAWMAVTFFLKDGLNVDPSTLQLLQNSANLPMVGKPLYGILSDAVYLRGQHRIPYIAIGVLLQAVSWFVIALLPLSNVSIITISIFLLLGNFGASIVEVANDALVAETGKQGSSPKKSQSSSSGELQSFVWMAASIGGILGNLLGGITVESFSAQAMFLAFGLLLTIQFFITASVHENSLNLPRNSSNFGIQKQFKELSLALQKPEIAYSLAWFASSYAIIPVLTGTMFFYQTQHLRLDSSVLGLSKVFGQAAMLLWSMIYNKRLKLIPPRKLISSVQATMAVFMLSDVLFVKGIYRNLGVPDSVYVVVFSGLLEVLFQFKVLPFSVLMAQLCPPGCEGSLMAFLMSAIALTTIVSGYLGVVLASYVGVSGDDLEGLPRGILIQAACTLIPLFWSSWIPSDVKSQQKKNKKEKHY
ncbi:probable folate-biopterin transporter 7 [Macadamia integrifolia]|uniref:probable folate-biopterin transporter 7 n=1 Tax=Macadamia integrifolia TaxID=60698 RepID=UPI001C4FE15F|nr:probable folate-biopterin transporter 7 [Macadamia integrifolia]